MSYQNVYRQQATALRQKAIQALDHVFTRGFIISGNCILFRASPVVQSKPASLFARARQFGVLADEREAEAARLGVVRRKAHEMQRKAIDEGYGA